MDFATAAALPLAGSTAWQIVHEAARIAPGQRVLIHGAGGGVGHLAVQICKAHGAFVIASASDSKHEYLRSLHVDQLIDYQKTRFEDSLDGKVDAVIDLIGGEISYRSLSVLHTGGVIVSVPSGQNPGIHHAAADLGLRAADIIVDTYRPTLESLVSLWEQGKLAVEVAETYDLSNVVAAHRAAENNRRPGKIVLTVAHEEKTTDTSERHFNLDG
jgi:NADPH:quinone reductase-like Zn-dependent oxidoreductase